MASKIDAHKTNDPVKMTTRGGIPFRLIAYLGGCIPVALFLIIIAGCSSKDATRSDADLTVAGDAMYSPFKLELGKRAAIEALNLTIEFTDVVTESFQLDPNVIPKDAKVYLTVRRGESQKIVEIRTNRLPDIPYECAGLLDELPTWLICLRKLSKDKGNYEVTININRFGYL